MCVYPPQGDYDKAVEYFGRTYEICTRMNDPEALHSARVQYGVAKGHQFMETFSSSVNDLSGGSMQSLLLWKHTRTEENDNDNNEASSQGSEDGSKEDVQADVVASVEATEETSD